MSAEGSIEAVQNFLMQRVQPQLTSELRSELRAAVKMLTESARQLREEPAADRDDCVKLIGELEREVERNLIPVDAPAVRDLRKRLDEGAAADLRPDVNGHVQQVIVRLQSTVHNDGSVRHADALRAWYRLLERRAQHRLNWQSVFPPAPGSPAATRK